MHPDHVRVVADFRVAADAILFAAAPEMAKALRATMQAADELMTEFVSKKRAANWGVINDALVMAGTLLRRI